MQFEHKGISFKLHPTRAQQLEAAGVIVRDDPDPAPTDEDGKPIPGFTPAEKPYTLRPDAGNLAIAEALLDLDGRYL